MIVNSPGDNLLESLATSLADDVLIFGLTHDPQVITGDGSWLDWSGYTKQPDQLANALQSAASPEMVGAPGLV
jgi:predicted phosphodiesterase